MILLLPVAGFPGEALLALLHRLELHMVSFTVAARQPGTCRGTGGVTISATRAIGDLRSEELGGVIVLDSVDGELRDDPTVLALVRDADRERVVVAGVGDGVLVLLLAGVLRACSVAADDDTADRLRELGAAPLLEPLVICDHLATTTESGAAALGDAIHDLRGPSVIAPEPPV